MKNETDDKEINLQINPEAVQDGFRFFSKTIKQMTEDLAGFNKKRKEVEERIKRGARRTDGRIV